MKGVQLERIGTAQDDKRRKLAVIFDGDFLAKRLKTITAKQDAVLGNHYHLYREFFFCITGEAHYTFQNIETGEKENIILGSGEKVTIEPKIAHAVLVKKGTVGIEGADESYSSAGSGRDVPFYIK